MTDTVVSPAPESSVPAGNAGTTSGPLPPEDGRAGDLSSVGEHSAIEAAMSRAEAKKAASAPPDQKPAAAARNDVPQNPQGKPGQAAGETGDSTRSGPPKSAGSTDAAAGGPPVETGPGDSTEQAPSDWPKRLREKYDALPPEGRAALREAHADFQRGFTQAMQRLAEERKSLPARTQELLALADAFDQDPQSTLEVLARQKGLSLRFGDDASAHQADAPPPEFESAADLARWAADAARRELQASLQQERSAAETRERNAQAEAQLRQELQDAANLPGWNDYRPAVLDRLAQNPALSVEEAYHLETLPALRKLAEQGQAAVAELAALKAQVESRSRRSLSPVGSGNGAGQEPERWGDLSPTEIALEKAKRKLAARRHS